ncbi:MAG TPA: hypothetical protein VKB38_18145 [Terracidiphilus sp.]|nr:hypothetical protein [Terracidiphilus sp.]
MYKRPGSIFSGLLAVALAIVSSVPALAQQPDAENDLKSQADKNQKVHSRIFQSSAIGTIPDLLAKTTGDITLTNGGDLEGSAPMEDPNEPPYPPVALVDLACYADAVVVAAPVAGVSHMTSDKGAIYSDWTMHVEEVLRDTPKAPIGGSETITVVRAGGKLVIDGRTVVVKAARFPEFEPGVNKYLLFLTYIPQTGAFRARTQSTFNLVLDKESAKRPHPYADPPSFARLLPSASPEELLTDARAAITYAAGIPYCATSRGDR